MEQSTAGPSTETSTKPACSFCGKPGHKEEKCWVRSPEQKQAYIKKRYGRDFKKGKEKRNDASANDDDNASLGLPIRVAGSSRTRPQQATLSTSGKMSDAPLVKKKKKTQSGRRKQLPSIDFQPELVFFGPSDKTAPRRVNRTPVKCSLIDLPDELVLKIIEHYDPCRHADNGDMVTGDSFPKRLVFEDRSVLKKLCLSSRRLYNIARPILGSFIYDNGTLKKRLELIRRFIRNPVAASYVQIIFVEPLQLRPAWKLSIASYPDICSLGKSIGLGSGVETVWIKHLLEGGTDADLALLLTQIPNVRLLHLTIESSLAIEYPWTLDLMSSSRWNISHPQNNIGSTGPLLKLRQIQTTYTYADEHPGFASHGIACMMDLPALTYLSIAEAWGNRLNPKDGDKLVSTSSKGTKWSSPIIWPEKVSNILSLSLQTSTLSSEFLRNIMRSCIALRDFNYSWSDMTEGDEADVGLSGLVENLSEHKHSLVMLALDCAEVDWFSRYQPSTLKPIGSFVEFTSLRMLEISGVLLVGSAPLNIYGESVADSESEADLPNHLENRRGPNYAALADIFPPSLQALLINDPGQSVNFFLPLLVELGRACKMEQRLPDLKSVVAADWFVPVGSESTQALIDQAKEYFADAGIEFDPPILGTDDSDTDYRDHHWGFGASDDDYGLLSDNSGDSYGFDDGVFYFP